MVLAGSPDDLGAGPHGDVRDVRDPLDQVVGHRLLQRRPADQQRHRLGEARQVQGGLAGRVRAADDVDVLPRARRGLGQRRTVVHPAPGQVVQPRRAQPPVGHPGSQDDGMRVDGGAVRERHPPRRAADLQAGHLPGGQHLGAELGGLPAGPVGQLRSGHPVREAQVVLDPRALPGLPAGRELLDQHGPQPLGRAVHRGAQPGRAAADHDQVVEVLGRRGGQPDPRGQLGVGRLDHGIPVRGDHHRQRQPVRLGGGQQPLAFRLVGLRTTGRAPGCGPGTPGPPRTAPTTGARPPWSPAPAGGRTPATRPAARRPPGTASPPAGPTA